jgi:tripartite-type tricarboxylate transporter receptor subunit TctC
LRGGWGRGILAQAIPGARIEGAFMLRSRRLAFAVAAVLLAAPVAQAEEYPTRSITLVVPYAAGGGNDAMARIVADHMGRTLGQQIVIENRGGAGGTIATRAAAKAAPDGYTLVLGGTGTLAINPTLYANVGYDPRKDFAPVGLIATSALVLLVHPAVQANTVPELIALARKEPAKLNYASAGVGSGIHLAAELFASMAGVKLTHVPYKGSGPALNDLLGGHVQLYFSSLPPAVGIRAEGKVRALAVTGPTRSHVLPDLPTVAEAALPGYEAVLHYGIAAPAGTPRPIVERLSAALRAALASDETKAVLVATGADPMPSTPEEYAADIDREERRWSRIVREVGVKAN